MNQTLQKRLSSAPRFSWGPGTILIGTPCLFILFLSGLRLQEAIAAFETDTPAAQFLAVVMALCIEAGAVLAAYRLVQLRRQEQPVPGMLSWGLAFFVAAPALANIDHILRNTVGNGTSLSGRPLLWEILLSAILSLLFPLGLVLAAEILAEYLQRVDGENATLHRFCEEVQRRLVRTEGAQAAQSQFQGEVCQQLAEIAQRVEVLAEEVQAKEQRLAETVESADSELSGGTPPSGESVSPWELLWQRTNGGGFNNDLVQQVFERGKTTAYQLMEEAIAGGLIEKVRPGRYRFVAADEQEVREWVAAQ